jgi:hypothetical protein
MRDIQKQILYNKYLHGDIELKDITSGDLKSLTVAWFDHKQKMMPLEPDYTAFMDELRRREKESASKPMKPIDRGFYE